MLEALFEKKFTIIVGVMCFEILIYSCDFHEGRQPFITLLMLVLNFAF